MPGFGFTSVLTWTQNSMWTRPKKRLKQPWSPSTISWTPDFCLKHMGPKWEVPYLFLQFFLLSTTLHALQLHVRPYGQSWLRSLSHIWGLSTHPELYLYTIYIYIYIDFVLFLFFLSSFNKLSARSPSRHSSLRTRVHIFIVSQSFQRHNTLFPCPIKHTNKLNRCVKARFTAIPLCW